MPNVIAGGKFLDKGFTLYLKGIACLIVALSHFSQFMLSHHLSDHFIYKILSYQGGYAGVALFFFLSGYGLMESEQKHHLNAKEFLLSRYWKIYRPLLIINIITFIVYYTLEIIHPQNIGDVFNYLFRIKIYDGVTWFVSVLFLCYVIFFVSTLVKSHLVNHLILLLGCVMLMTYMIYRNIDSYFMYLSIPMFFVGNFISMYKKMAQILFRKWTICAISIIVCVVILVFSRKMGFDCFEHLCLNIILLIIFLWIASCYPINVKYQSFLGKISYELYLTHYRVLTVAIALWGGISFWNYLLAILVTGYIMNWICNFRFVYIKKIIMNTVNNLSAKKKNNQYNNIE